ncbi:cysteine protease StiP domain-containing protein [Sphingomonas sp. 1P06PA]|uniref:cysteine protease StiP domain-containing protein n=1 Tax=Sphingomonas sp. 1P06PA TaxID=554121 RepID=UPI0039A65BDA
MSFHGSYDPQDVTFLLKPVDLAPTPIADKEAAIQSGARHYSEMLSVETPPGADYLALYDAALARNGRRLAQDIVTLAAAIDARAPAGREIVLASFARAGTPIGVLLRRALVRIGRTVTHYSISIIRDRGIDRVALAHIAAAHDPTDVVFVDGWTGKGAIAAELHAALARDGPDFAPVLAVVADPAGVAELAASADDYLIASGLLNAIVSGLVSRTVLNAALVRPGDFHACVHYRDFEPIDRSRAFVDHVDALAQGLAPLAPAAPDDAPARRQHCRALLEGIMALTDTTDRNRIKPGIAEATRAVLRRLPDRLFLRDAADPDVAHLVHLASEKSLAVEPLAPGSRYRAVAVIKSLGSE